MLTREEIRKTGQSLWLDNLSRQLLFSGGLSRLVRERAVTGLTSNPSIFEKALAGEYYAAPIKKLAAGGASAEEIFEVLAVEDIQRAADLLRPVYDASGGLDGFVSMEVSPKLAFDAARTESEGLRLAERIGRRNLMIKVPATKQGLLAGENLLKKGVSVNFTLIFTVNRYSAVTQAYTHAMSWRLKHSLPVEGIASVASFFVSRIDTAVDKLLKALPPGPARKLAGRAAVENSLLAYRLYRDLFYCPGFRASGIPPQRILWASTSVKDPAYRPSLYMEELALDGSVNTAPEEALEAYFSGGRINAGQLAARFAAAEAYFAELKELGLDFGAILEDLEKDGIEKFARSHDGLLARIQKEIAAVPEENMQEELAGIDASAAVKELAAMNFAGRLWKKDPELWKKDEAAKKQISGALGWVDIPYKMLARVNEIEDFAEEIRAAGFTHAVLLGMGGSSLAPEVIRGVFQNPKFPRLLVLDTTDPAWIESVAGQIDLKRTLFIFASKSGGTIEPSSHFKYFWSLVKKAGIKNPGNNFMAVTDSGTGLEKLAAEKKFRKVFINPSDIGGRFSALSCFGMVPAALCGADIRKLLERAISAADLCKEPAIEKNPGALLGALMGSLALQGRDKLTLILPEKLKYFGLWVEQLVAESTGKEGKGIIPVCLEPLMEPDKYQADRFFVRVKLEGFTGAVEEAGLAALKKAGHPVYTITVKDPYDLGAEFFRWEAATAAAGALMKINPFDQPNVQEAKLLTMQVLAKYAEKGKRAAPKPDFSAERVAVYASRALKNADKTIASYDDVFWSVFSALGEKEYIGLLAYLPNSPKVEAELIKLRESLTRYTSSACTLAYGPRYLHSSGQLHKGGPDNAFFIILTNQAKKDIVIPGEKYTFWQLETAQAMGDFEALDAKNRRVLRLHLKHPLDKSLAYLSERIARIGKPGESPAAPEAEESTMLKLTVKKNAKTTTTATKTKLVDTNEYVVVDHPKNLETITSRQYSVRIGASDCTGVDISVNDQPWQPCRNAVGYWWFDWSNLQPGTHQLVARMHKSNGEYLISKRRRCKVS